MTRFAGSGGCNPAAFEDGPMPAIHGVVRWRIVDLIRWLSDELQVPVSKQTLGVSCARWAELFKGMPARQVE